MQRIRQYVRNRGTLSAALNVIVVTYILFIATATQPILGLFLLACLVLPRLTLSLFLKRIRTALRVTAAFIYISIALVLADRYNVIALPQFAFSILIATVCAAIGTEFWIVSHPDVRREHPLERTAKPPRPQPHQAPKTSSPRTDRDLFDDDRHVRR